MLEPETGRRSDPPMAEAQGGRSWRLERYRKGDEHAILDLFRTVFGRSRSLEHWQWQFAQNPYGGPYVSLARRESDGAVVGSYSVMPIRLNVMGNPVPACQSVDTAVHPDARGQRVFEKTASDCYAWCESEGIRAVIGFPNASSYPGFMRSLAWRRIVFPIQHQMRLGIGGAVRRAIGVPGLPALTDLVYRAGRRMRLAARRAFLRRVGGDGEFRISETVPEGYGALWSTVRSQEVLSVWKDADYLQWRYDRNPDHKFRYFQLLRGATLAALAVGVPIEGALVLCELMAAGRDVAIGRRLVAEIALHALAAGHRAVSFLGADPGWFADALDGFERQNSYANAFCGRSFEEGTLAELLPHAANWTVTFGDGDFV